MKNSSRFKRVMLATASITPLILIKPVSAHCPLCTIGAAAAAGGAAYLGVSVGIIGVFIGAFAASMGWWFSKLIKKQFVPQQKAVLVLLSFITTIIPMLKMFDEPIGYYLNIAGDYGTLLNSTYLLNPFLIGSILGLVVVSITPMLSTKITAWRKGRMIPYQGIGLTFALLLITSLMLEWVL